MATKQRKTVKEKNASAATIGYEAELWQMADTLRGSMDAAEYKHVVLGLIFLKYISDAFEEAHARLEAERRQGADPEDQDEYRAQNIFWVPPEARWAHIQKQAKQPTIGQIVDDAMAAIERDNPQLKGVLPKDYARPALDKTRLGQLIDVISNIRVGDEESRSKDVLGRVYEYFLSQFADAEGKKGGEFYTPRCVVKLLVEMLEPYKGRVYDPCCGSAGMFVQSVEFIRAHQNGNGNGGRATADISIYGQESNYTTWRLARMNLAIRGIEGQIAHGDTFHNDGHADLKADFILANPPFNVSDWGGERLKDDKRWQYGVPPKGNANFGWVQHIVHHLSPAGVAGFVLSNGSMSSNQSGEGEIRKNLIEADVVDCMVALPGQLFYSTQIPACLWFLARDRRNGKFRDCRGEVLFIDARKLGRMVDRTHRELTDEDVARITVDSPVPFKLGTIRAKVEADRPPQASKQEKHNSILQKLDVLMADARLSFLMSEWGGSATDPFSTIVSQLVSDGPKPRVIDLSGVPNEVAGVCSAVIARTLFNLKVWQTAAERASDPVVLVCEEAHRYVPNRGEAQYEAAQAAIRRIAKEGRKYGVGLLLVSQRPSEVEATVLSQCNSWIVLRVTNEADRAHVKAILPDSMAGLTKMLSGLRRQEAIFLGQAAMLPSRVMIRDLAAHELPKSNDMDFDAGWQSNAMSAADLTSVANRWRYQTR